MVRAHEVTWKCAFVLWACPAALGAQLSFIATLCWVRMRSYRMVTTQGANLAEEKDEAYVVASVKHLTAATFSIAVVVWITAALNATGDRHHYSTNTKREDMRDEVVGLSLLAFVAFAGWTLDTLGPMEVANAMKDSKVMVESRKILQADWSRGFIVLFFALPMAVYAFIKWMYWETCGRAKPVEERRSILDFASDWGWTSILVKAQSVGVTYVVLLVALGKMTTVALSMVNELLSSWSIWAVSLAIFLILFCMSMSPTSPGPPLYVLAGIATPVGAAMLMMDADKERCSLAQRHTCWYLCIF